MGIRGIRSAKGIFQVIPLLIVGLGISIPLTAVLIISIIVKLASGDSYQLDLTKIFTIYLGALLGWALIVEAIQLR